MCAGRSRGALSAVRRLPDPMPGCGEGEGVQEGLGALVPSPSASPPRPLRFLLRLGGVAMQGAPPLRCGVRREGSGVRSHSHRWPVSLSDMVLNLFSWPAGACPRSRPGACASFLCTPGGRSTRVASLGGSTLAGHPECDVDHMNRTVMRCSRPVTESTSRCGRGQRLLSSPVSREATMVNFARCGSRQAVGRMSLFACLMKR
jgi:hypothetical protein